MAGSRQCNVIWQNAGNHPRRTQGRCERDRYHRPGQRRHGIFRRRASGNGASLKDPVGIALNASGDLFIADQGNYRIRKVANGIITTVAGKGRAGFSGDGGQANSADLSSPGLPQGGSGGKRLLPGQLQFSCVLLTNGVIATVAGNGCSVASGDGGQATSDSEFVDCVIYYRPRG